ncbi:hypothetical protein RFI_33023 [Reticulomyxa filosa]|uniref:Uncharacterized protein n=1 Tax=Reticulomyxa filosa TaxID=46433 RepID=X6LRZ0_RETFI|nr:hypothetical protein RFI_33023 [Reticulomyxa filosa]|eukprot:ETO04374.1 hypothetical protein RFI_33023 [Reticulomyxa filosa]
MIPSSEQNNSSEQKEGQKRPLHVNNQSPTLAIEQLESLNCMQVVEMNNQKEEKQDNNNEHKCQSEKNSAMVVQRVLINESRTKDSISTCLLNNSCPRIHIVLSSMAEHVVSVVKFLNIKQLEN